MSYHGDIRLGDTITFLFTTRQISGAPFTLAGSPVISAYVGSGTTQITAGVSLGVDHDGVTGLNLATIVATGGNGFATATNIEIVITTGTVNSVSVVGEVVGSFSIGARSALMPTTAGRTLVVDSAGLADANVTKWLGTAVSTPTTAGVPQVDMVRAQGNSDAATGLSIAGIHYDTFDHFDSDLNVLSSAITTVNSQTEFVLTSGSTVDDSYNGLMVILNGSLTERWVARAVDYVGATKTLTISAAAYWTVDTSDSLNIIAVPEQVTNLPTATAGAAGGVFIAGTNAATTITTGLTTTFTGNLTGGINTGSGTITTLDGLDTAQDTQHATTQAAIAGIGTAGGAAISVDPTTDNAAGGISGVTSGTTKVGTETGTFANTSNVDASYHQITHSGNAIDWVYQFLTGGGTSVVDFRWTGYISGSNDTITFYAWNHVGGAWETMGTQAGQNGTANVVKSVTLFARHRGTSAAELGKVYVRLACTAMTSPVLYTDQLIVDYAVTSRSVGYANGEVWIDTVSGTAGTESFVNGVADNPVLTLADALTIATANKLTQFDVANGSTITLAGATTTKRFSGHEWILALGGQDISGTNFEGANAVTGTSSGTTDVQFEDCVIGNGSTGATLPPGTYIRCGFNTGSGFAFTGSAAGRYVFVDCYSNIAVGGASTPFFVFTGASAVMFRRYSGGANITFDAATAALTYECLGGGNLTVALAGSDLQARGTIRDMTITGMTTASLVEFVGTMGNVSLAGADGTVTLDGIVGAVVDSRTGSPVLNRPVNTMGMVGDITGTLATLTTYTGNTVQTGDTFALANGANGFVATKADTAAILVDTAEIGAAGVGLTEAGGTGDQLTALATQASVDDLPTNAELATAIITGLTTALTEGYRATGATGSVRDMLYEMLAHLGEFAIVSTTKTTKKLDGSTTAKTYTLDSATTPTSITEAT